MFAEQLQLFDCRGTVYVGGNQQRAPALFLEPQRQFAGLRRFSRPLQTDEHDHRRRCVGELQARLRRTARRAKQCDEFVVDDLDDRLRRRQRFENVGADGAFLNASDEGLGRRKGDVGFKQGYADFAQRFVDFALGYPASAAEAIEDRAQPFT